MKNKVKIFSFHVEIEEKGSYDFEGFKIEEECVINVVKTLDSGGYICSINVPDFNFDAEKLADICEERFKAECEYKCGLL